MEIHDGESTDHLTAFDGPALGLCLCSPPGPVSTAHRIFLGERGAQEKEPETPLSHVGTCENCFGGKAGGVALVAGKDKATAGESEMLTTVTYGFTYVQL